MVEAIVDALPELTEIDPFFLGEDTLRDLPDFDESRFGWNVFLLVPIPLPLSDSNHDNDAGDCFECEDKIFRIINF